MGAVERYAPVENYFAARFRHRQEMQAILYEVSEVTGYGADDILGSGQGWDLTAARHYAWWRCRELGLSNWQIGRFFGRDASTVSVGIKSILGKAAKWNKAQ